MKEEEKGLLTRRRILEYCMSINYKDMKLIQILCCRRNDSALVFINICFMQCSYICFWLLQRLSRRKYIIGNTILEITCQELLSIQFVFFYHTDYYLILIADNQACKNEL